MILSDRQAQFKEAMKKLLVGRGAISFNLLESKSVGLATLLFDDLSEAEVAEVVAALTEEHTVTLTPGGTVVDLATFEPWLSDRRGEVLTPRWDAYEKLLVSRDWAAPVIRSLAEQTDEVVELLGDPSKPGSWARRGLLMGEVQSGKTATYIGVLNKALDYGYRVVIVVGGHTNELRRQTQVRFDTDLLGIDSEYLDDNIANAKLPQVGVGLIAPGLRANVMTTVRGDFGSSKKSAGITFVESNLPTVFVIKKNAKLIANVANYIRQQAPDGVLDIPLVVIDDEADWGTPNTGSETDPTRVNQEIRKLLASSRRSTYLGITATPFANIFIDHEAVDDEGGEDLFPRDYIRVMPAPSSYLGMRSYFLPHDAAIRKDVDDCLEIIPITHKKTQVISELPSSLKRAVASFLIGTSMRRLRDRGVRSASMMVNVSRFNDVQAQAADLVQTYLHELVAAILGEFARGAVRQSETALFVQSVWASDFNVDSDIEWPDVMAVLVDIASEFRVDLVNSKTASARSKRRRLLSAEQRRAEDLQPTIFVGGDVLSRGLTLEGLQVSYFVREPRSMDTLMQMGRWFGYRPGFGDLVRVWMPQTTAEDFEWSASVTEELRELLLEMRARELTPRDFGLRVRTHPEGFSIVAANKSRNTDVVYEGPVLWQDKLAEAWRLSSSFERQDENRIALAELVDGLQELVKTGSITTDVSSGGYVSWRGVSIDRIYAFFRRFRGHPLDPFWGSSEPELHAQIVGALAEAKGSSSWDVALVEGNGLDVLVAPGVSVRSSVRDSMGLDGDLIKVGNRRVATESNLVAAFSRAQRAAADVRGDLARWPSQSAALHALEHPVLLLYVFTTKDPEPPRGLKPVVVDPMKPLVTVAVAFPKLDVEEATALAARAKKYRVNTVWLQNSSGYLDDGDDVEDGEEVDL